MNPTKPDTEASGLKTANRETVLAAALEETNSLLVAMLHENRSLAEIEERIHDNRTVLNAEATTTRSADLDQTLPGEFTSADALFEAMGVADAPRVWLCSCGSPELPGVLHRADRPCAAVRDEGGASC
jgi:hypothetical protein